MSQKVSISQENEVSVNKIVEETDELWKIIDDKLNNQAYLLGRLSTQQIQSLTIIGQLHSKRIK